VLEPLAEAVATRRRLVGTVLTLPGASVAELLAEPFDLVWIDLEHGALGPHEAQEMLLGAQAAGTYGLVRLPADAHGLMTAMLDAGADGIVLANVDDAAIAATAAARVAHPPDGTRGWGPRRLAWRRRLAGRVPARASLWVQIESAAGAANAGEIVGVPGVDVVAVGTADLSFSVGTPLDTASTPLLEAVDTVRHASHASEVALGIAGALDAVPAQLLAAASILVHGTDARLCARAMDDTATWLREGVATGPASP
jgi:4-hydroxy-2-oxoheptanedioate aldolase